MCSIEFVKLCNKARKKIHIFVSVSGWFVSDAGDGAGDVFDVVHGVKSLVRNESNCVWFSN